MKVSNSNKYRGSTVLNVSGVDISTPNGRPLIRDLHLTLGREQVALIGRNGVGKSTLLRYLNSQTPSGCRAFVSKPETFLVPQSISNQSMGTVFQEVMSAIFCDDYIPRWRVERELEKMAMRTYDELSRSAYFSEGERRKLVLLYAKLKQPALLLLDEPTQDLDEVGINWLQHWLQGWSSGLMVVSHDNHLLSMFHHFLTIDESGCQYFNGDFDHLLEKQEKNDSDRKKQFLYRLNTLKKKEEHNRQVIQRREQKKNQGRWRELGRMTPKVRLNKKRGYAQLSQARAAKTRQDRIDKAREVVKCRRRQVPVSLLLKMCLPDLPEHDGNDIIVLRNLSVSLDNRKLFSGLTLSIQRERVAVIGKNGSGKSTLLRTILHQHPSYTGYAYVHSEKVGVIEQGAVNWKISASLYLLLQNVFDDKDRCQQILSAHQFPLALARRSLCSLSPGERVRAALICLLVKRVPIEFLILDEPCSSLDETGLKALTVGLNVWRGGMLVVSHNAQFLRDIDIQRYVKLTGSADS